MSRQEEIRQLKIELGDVLGKRIQLENERDEHRNDFKKYLKFSNEICVLSVKRMTIERKIHNLENNQPLLGHPLPSHSTTDMAMQGRGGQKPQK